MKTSKDKDDDSNYKPVPFVPTDPYDETAYLCNVMLKNNVMMTEEGEPFDENMIVEFQYVLNNNKGWNWVPLRVRYDKTNELQNGMKNYGNAYHVANNNWRSIHYPITSQMLRSGEGFPSYYQQADIYYNRKTGQSYTRGLRDFHNLYVKNNLINSVLKPGNTLIDYSVGKAGDMSKWMKNKPSFVFGIDISRDNIHNKIDGFGSQLQACFSLIAYCHYKEYTYIHNPFYKMHHNDENLANFPKIMNDFMNLEHVYQDINTMSNHEKSQVHRVKEGYFVHGSLHPEFFYNKEVLEELRTCYNSNPKPNIENIYKPNTYNIALHIRRGDVAQTNRHSSRFTHNIEYINIVGSLTLPENSVIHVFSEGSIDDFQDIKTAFPETIFHLNTNIQETFHCMVKADMLIISKSSFCYCAALLNENKVNGTLIKSWWHKPLKSWL